MNQISSSADYEELKKYLQPVLTELWALLQEFKSQYSLL